MHVFLESLVSSFFLTHACLMQPWDGLFDVLFWFQGFVFRPSFVFPLWIYVWHVWIIGWDCSMFFCPSSPWLCHQSLLHRVVGALSYWEYYVSRRFEATCSWRAWPWNLFQFEHLWHSQVGKLQKLALAVWAWKFLSFLSIFSSKPSGTLFSLGVSACSWRKSVLSLASSSLHWALELQTPTAQALWMPRKPWAGGNFTAKQTKTANLPASKAEKKHCCRCVADVLQRL